MVDEIERNVVELGVEGRLIKIQLDEMTEWVPGDEVAMVRDYELSEVTGGYRRALDQLRDACRTTSSSSSSSWPRCWATRAACHRSTTR